jgi:hypothetical protein
VRVITTTSHEEISRILDIPIGTVKSLLSRGLEVARGFASVRAEQQLAPWLRTLGDTVDDEPRRPSTSSDECSTPSERAGQTAMVELRRRGRDRRRRNDGCRRARDDRMRLDPIGDFRPPPSRCRIRCGRGR